MEYHFRRSVVVDDLAAAKPTLKRLILSKPERILV